MPSFDDLEPVNRETTASIIAERIRTRIMDGTFPPGLQLGEAQLAGRLQVSRGPVREAMQRLIQEGVLYNERHRGVFVATLDAADIVDIYLARGAVERAAALLVSRAGDAAAFVELEDIIGQMDAAATAGEWSRVADVDLEFHQALVKNSGSRRLVRMFRTLMVETRMCLTTLEPAYPRHEEIVVEHRRLLDAVRGDDEELLSERISEHMQTALKDLHVQEG